MKKQINILSVDKVFEEMGKTEGAIIITGVVKKASPKNRKLIAKIFAVNDDDLDATAGLYFHWFNIIHELLCYIVTIQWFNARNYEIKVSGVGSFYSFFKERSLGLVYMPRDRFSIRE